MTRETKLGIFVMVGMFCLILSIMLLGDFQLQRRYHLNILFNDIAGLPDKAEVKIAGVKVGAVRKISLEGNKAKVQVWIKEGIEIHSDAEARIIATGVIGTKYLELTMGSPTAPILGNYDTIRGIDPISFDKIISDAMEKLDDIVGVFSDTNAKEMGRNLAGTLENLRKVSDTLRIALYRQEEKLSNIVDDISTFTNDLAEVTSENKDDLKVAIKSIRNVGERLDRILVKIENGEGTIGKLLSDDEMGEDIKSTVSDLKETSKEAKRVMKRINLIETHWDYRLRYDSKYSMYRHDIGLRIFPRPEKYYYVGVSNVGESSDDTIVDIEDTNTFNLLIGRKYAAFEGYAGMIRSKGGIGVEIRPFWKWDPLRRLEVTAEAYDFFRKTPVEKPNVSLGGKIEVADWAYLGAQLEDTYHESNLNTYMNVVFRDDDIAYILGLVGLAR